MRTGILPVVFALTLACGAPAAHGADPAQYISERLEIAGHVKQPQVLDVDALAVLPQAELAGVPMRCSPEREKGTPSGYGGVPLRTLLEHAGIDTDEHHSRNRSWIAAGASDGYAVVFSWHELFNSPIGDGVLVVLRRDGVPLGDDGRIGLISARDTFTCGRHVKWLNRIEVLRYEPRVQP